VAWEFKGWVPDPERVLEKALRAGASEAEVYVSYGDYLAVEAKNNVIERAQEDSRVMLGIRVAVGKRIASAGGEVSSEGDVDKIIERAVSMARASPEDPSWPGFNPRVEASLSPRLFDETVAGFGPDDLVELLGKAVHAAAGGGDIRVYLAAGAARASRGGRIYANTGGGPVEDKGTALGVMVEYKAEGPQGEGTYYDGYFKANYDPGRIEEMIARAYKRVRDAVQAKPWTTMQSTIVLDRDEAAGILRWMLSPALSAEQVQKGRSPLAGKLGEQVFSTRLTIRDDPSIDWEPGSGGFDDEGHPTEPRNVLEEGVLKTYLYDHYTASRDGKESTGNASRPRPWSKPSPAPHNLVVVDSQGVESLDKLLSSFDQAVLIVSTIGSWMSNPVSGRINATVTLGYLVKKGSIEAVLKGLTWGDDLFRALGPGYAGMAGKAECSGGVCVGHLAVADAALAGK